MNIEELGGEFNLLNRLLRPARGAGIIAGPGDDCAVLELDADNYLLFTTDMLVDVNHFSLEWSSPFQVGKKLVESNVSDIVSMGGTPAQAVVSIALKKDTSVEFVEELYNGIYSSAERHGVQIVGGDTVRGSEYAFNLALLGRVSKSGLRLRSMARKGDLLCVTGTLGGSAAGLELLRSGKSGANGVLNKYLEPHSRTAEEGKAIARYAGAMIDVSDGLASEVRHICYQSRVGAVIEREKIPLAQTTIDAAKQLSLDAFDWALYGGEDYELVFSLPSDNLEALKKEFADFTVVGRIVAAEEGISLFKDGVRQELGKGFDHFAASK